MLFRQHRRRHQHRHLPRVHHGDEGRAYNPNNWANRSDYPDSTSKRSQSSYWECTYCQ
jgi:hypothetical protein